MPHASAAAPLTSVRIKLPSLLLSQDAQALAVLLGRALEQGGCPSSALEFRRRLAAQVRPSSEDILALGRVFAHVRVLNSFDGLPPWLHLALREAAMGWARTRLLLGGLGPFRMSAAEREWMEVCRPAYSPFGGPSTPLVLRISLGGWGWRPTSQTAPGATLPFDTFPPRSLRPSLPALLSDWAEPIAAHLALEPTPTRVEHHQSSGRLLFFELSPLAVLDEVL